MAKKTTTAGGTPATVELTRRGFAFTVHAFEAAEPGSRGYGLEAAAHLGVDEDRVFKTLVADADGELVVGIVPVSGQLDLHALAGALGAKRAVMADPALAEKRTGYVRGGISPIGQRSHHRTLLDETAVLFDTIFVSAGKRGLDLELAPDILLTATGGAYAAIGR